MACGLPDVTVTSMAEVLSRVPSMNTVMDETIAAFARVFHLKMAEEPAAALAAV